MPGNVGQCGSNAFPKGYSQAAQKAVCCSFPSDVPVARTFIDTSTVSADYRTYEVGDDNDPSMTCPTNVTMHKCGDGIFGGPDDAAMSGLNGNTFTCKE